MYRHGPYHRGIDGPRFVALLHCGGPLHRQPLELIEHVPPVDDFAKNCIDIVQVWLPLVCYEELRPIRVGAGICLNSSVWSVRTRENRTTLAANTGTDHADLSSFVMSIVVMEFILELPTPYRLSPLSRPRGIAPLDHEALDISTLVICSVSNRVKMADGKLKPSIAH